MNTSLLDSEEQDLLQSFEAEEWQSALTADRSHVLEHSAAQAFKKDKRINIRISTHDLEAIQRRAFESGMPYQTLISSVLHKYVSGSLYDLAANKPAKSNNA